MKSSLPPEPAKESPAFLREEHRQGVQLVLRDGRRS
jgi:hypothetical protein